MKKPSDMELMCAEHQLEAEWTAEARWVYKTLFGEPLPKKWKFWWNIEGATLIPSNKYNHYVILMDRGLQTKHQYETLIHEFFHVRGHDHQEMYDEAIEVVCNLFWKLRKYRRVGKMVNKMLGRNAFPARRFKSSR